MRKARWRLRKKGVRNGDEMRVTSVQELRRMS
jgi:hypothetical protein